MLNETTFMNAVLGRTQKSSADVPHVPPLSGGSSDSSGSPPSPQSPSGDIGGGGRRHPPARRSAPGESSSPRSNSEKPSLFYIFGLIALFVVTSSGYLYGRDWFEERSLERAVRMKESEAKLAQITESIKKKETSSYVSQQASDTENVKMFHCQVDTSVVDPLKACFDKMPVLVASGAHPYSFGAGYSLVRFERAVSSVSGTSYAASVYDPSSNGFRNSGPLSKEKGDAVKLINEHLGVDLRVVGSLVVR